MFTEFVEMVESRLSPEVADAVLAGAAEHFCEPMSITQAPWREAARQGVRFELALV